MSLIRFCDELDHFHSRLIDEIAYDLDHLHHTHDWWSHPWCSHHCMTCRRPWSQVIVDKDGFKLTMDVNKFKSDEICVKTVENVVIVEGQQKERDDNRGYILRHFIRRYTLPRGYDSKDVVSSLSSDGILTVTAPAPDEIPENYERIVEIKETGTKYAIKDKGSDEDRSGAKRKK